MATIKQEILQLLEYFKLVFLKIENVTTLSVISEYTTASVYAYYLLPIGHVYYSIISLPIGHSVSYKNICMLTWRTVGLHYLNILVLYLMVMCLGRGIFRFQMWMFFDLKLSSKYGWKLTVEQISSKIE